MIRTIRLALAGAIIAASCTAASAQTLRVRGTSEGHRPYAPVPNSTMTNGSASGATVAGVDGTAILVRYKDGEKKIVVPPSAPIVRYEIGGKGDLKAGTRFTVLAATQRPDGTLEANRINVGRDGVVPQ